MRQDHYQRIKVMNNLENLIRQAGLSKKEFAEMNNITPATLSRHMHGKVPMTVKDAERYGALLDVHARAVLFPVARVPILAKRYLQIKNFVEVTEHKLLTPSTEAIEIPAHYQDNMLCVEWLIHKDYTGTWAWCNGAYNLYPSFPVIQGFVDEACFKSQSLCRLAEPTLGHGIKQDVIAAEVYPCPNGRYTLHSQTCDVHLEKVELVWATPLISVISRPDLRGVRKIKI